MTSIVIPAFGRLEFTQLCVSAVVRHTQLPFELIAISNGSTDRTVDYLAGLQDTAHFPVKVILNGSNLDFPQGCNQVLAAATGNYLVFLNNGVIVTDSWLDQLVALAEVVPDIGMAGPVSNDASPPQLVTDAMYANLEAMDAFASEHRRRHRGRWLETRTLSGFCLLVKRIVLERVGMLNEGLGIDLFDDLSFRVTRTGFRLAVALDLFVHQFDDRALTDAGFDNIDSLFQGNRGRFESNEDVVAFAGREVPIGPRMPTLNAAI